MEFPQIYPSHPASPTRYLDKEEELMVDYFHILGVSSSSSDDEVKRRYYAEAKKWHPDQNSSPEANARFKLINAAYQELQVSIARLVYTLMCHNSFCAGLLSSKNSPLRVIPFCFSTSDCQKETGISV